MNNFSEFDRLCKTPTYFSSFDGIDNIRVSSIAIFGVMKRFHLRYAPGCSNLSAKTQHKHPNTGISSAAVLLEASRLPRQRSEGARTLDGGVEVCDVISSSGGGDGLASHF